MNACQRHMEFFNTAGYYGGSIIMGLGCSLEEERANGLPIEGEDISAIKTGLMGPLAGVFDALRQGTANPYRCLHCDRYGKLARQLFGPIFYMIVTVLYAHGALLLDVPDLPKKGKEAVNGLFASGKLERFMTLGYGSWSHYPGRACGYDCNGHFFHGTASGKLGHGPAGNHLRSRYSRAYRRLALSFSLLPAAEKAFNI